MVYDAPETVAWTQISYHVIEDVDIKALTSAVERGLDDARTNDRARAAKVSLRFLRSIDDQKVLTIVTNHEYPATPVFTEREEFEAAIGILLEARRAINADPPDNALLYAAWHEERRVIEMLVDSGVDIDHQADFCGMPNTTALHFAAERRDGGLVRTLLENKASTEICAGDWYSTPLKEALVEDNREVVALLLKAGAKVDLGAMMIITEPLIDCISWKRTGKVQVQIMSMFAYFQYRLLCTVQAESNDLHSCIKLHSRIKVIHGYAALIQSLLHCTDKQDQYMFENECKLALLTPVTCASSSLCLRSEQGRGPVSTMIALGFDYRSKDYPIEYVAVIVEQRLLRDRYVDDTIYNLMLERLNSNLVSHRPSTISHEATAHGRLASPVPEGDRAASGD